ncbi:glycoside hydrolase family 16 protein [Rhizobium sp.]
MLIRLGLALSIFVLLFAGAAQAERLRFSGYDFKVKKGDGLGPGPNDWATSQAFVDTSGRLHLRFSKKKGKWLAGEVQSVSRLGYGTYEMEFEGDIAGQDRNVVFGFFNYPTPDVGPDATNEIDVEFARWGRSNYKPLNYTVWPARKGMKNAHKVFSFRQGYGKSIHRFTWKRDSVVYTSEEIRGDGSTGATTYWAFAPKSFKDRISTKPMPVYFNLWGFQGRPPSDDRPVEVIINRFSFTPAE